MRYDPLPIIEVVDPEPVEVEDGCNCCLARRVAKVVVLGRRLSAYRIRLCAACVSRLRVALR